MDRCPQPSLVSPEALLHTGLNVRWAMGSLDGACTHTLAHAPELLTPPSSPLSQMAVPFFWVPRQIMHSTWALAFFSYSTFNPSANSVLSNTDPVLILAVSSQSLLCQAHITPHLSHSNSSLTLPFPQSLDNTATVTGLSFIKQHEIMSFLCSELSSGFHLPQSKSQNPHSG